MFIKTLSLGKDSPTRDQKKYMKRLIQIQFRENTFRFREINSNYSQIEFVLVLTRVCGPFVFCHLPHVTDRPGKEIRFEFVSHSGNFSSSVSLSLVLRSGNAKCTAPPELIPDSPASSSSSSDVTGNHFRDALPSSLQGNRFAFSYLTPRWFFARVQLLWSRELIDAEDDDAGTHRGEINWITIKWRITWLINKSQSPSGVEKRQTSRRRTNESQPEERKKDNLSTASSFFLSRIEGCIICRVNYTWTTDGEELSH